ncbi:MAG: bifunctional methylenetetrahydrofolate dehydrogenase/methenyltetrahydrofolate cyclohydrolase FolD [Deltaproteobacteria bacterium]|nr:MAG: bifunctional methylenetetrahydrofolate dehydrogenase/methenyltetrahydrofolate cyclohydrolase FolD [Deltaproteobacteria bacterium]
MPAEIISGKQVAEEMREEFKEEIEKLKKEHGITPGLAVVLVGEDPASQVYVKNKKIACEKVGINSIEHRLPADYPEDKLIELIESLNKDDKVHGILVQLPLPKHISEVKVLYTILPEKDVDGFHPVNVGKLMIGEADFLPCTPAGIQQLLIRSGTKIEGAEVVVVGRSNIVGKPIANILLQKSDGANATVTICHTRTKDMPSHTKRADILIVAAGKPKAVTANMVKKGAVVIDVGVNRLESGLCGDVDFEAVKEVAAKITPVPGGVGPMTITMLLKNTIKAAKLRIN